MLVRRLNSGFRGSLWFLIVFYAILLVLNLLGKNTNETAYYPNIFYNYFENQINSDFAVFLINQLILIGGLSFVAYIISNEEIVEKLNYFPLFIFLVLNVIIADKERVSAFLLSNVIVLYIMYKLFDTYRKDNVLSNLFNACFWASVSLFLNITNVFIFPVIFISLLVLRPFNWREFAISILGAIAPVFIYECIAYLVNFNQWYIFESIPMLFANFKAPGFSFQIIPLFVVIALLFLLSMLFYMLSGLGNTVKKQKAKSIFFWFLLFVVPAVFTAGMSYIKILTIFSIPLSFLIGDYFFQIKKTKLTNVLLVLILISLMYFFVSKTGLI